ncbi:MULTISPECIES: hypothetical protein [unclassified Fusibacter]|uniref:hypothetical protein n=1 Tax=unclassified Fusibacter TaxID=2624464 RepID=UPI00101027FB|nr:MULTISPECIES: hypothetical protein [unclassified Fusibacter]MCK8058958.1 hypothetical protein [Fusibacter sp. A2]NPE22035.1 hypothetical protein [Fusibacter sp. A1]RXV61599.1 hypothetical protein DWB64_09330 [Fusibacter sp. A1]
MKVIDWLMQGDPVIRRLTSTYLLEVELPSTEDGYIKKYIDLFDDDSGLWGKGIYSPKWISTHYTMRELKYMEIDFQHPYYQKAMVKLVDQLWRSQDYKSMWKRPDLCVVAMVLSLAAYGRFTEVRTHEMVDELLDHQMEDGGWNCEWNYKKHLSTRGSIHTTLTVLEAFRDYGTWGDGYRSEEMQEKSYEGEEYLLERRLFHTVSTGEVIKKDFLRAHYPPRWKYDYLRALEYFASVKRHYDERMKEGLDLIKKNMRKGFMPKGSQYGGELHFRLEDSRAGRFNTLRALKVLKRYDKKEYQRIIETDFESL